MKSYHPKEIILANKKEIIEDDIITIFSGREGSGMSLCNITLGNIFMRGKKC